MNPLKIRLKRHPDGSASLTCTRADGSVTWQRQNGQLGMVFPPHDLTHYAVESTLGYHKGFYGLVADGWEIGDFAAPWPRGEIPDEAREVELIIGLLDTERRSMERWPAEQINELARTRVSTSRYPQTPVRELTENELESVRSLRDSLLHRWHQLSPGDSLELEFVRR